MPRQSKQETLIGAGQLQIDGLDYFCEYSLRMNEFGVPVEERCFIVSAPAALLEASVSTDCSLRIADGRSIKVAIVNYEEGDDDADLTMLSDWTRV